jgi:hypothetical protein
MQAAAAAALMVPVVSDRSHFAHPEEKALVEPGVAEREESVAVVLTPPMSALVLFRTQEMEVQV